MTFQSWTFDRTGFYCAITVFALIAVLCIISMLWPVVYAAGAVVVIFVATWACISKATTRAGDRYFIDTVGLAFDESRGCTASATSRPNLWCYWPNSDPDGACDECRALRDAIEEYANVA